MGVGAEVVVGLGYLVALFFNITVLDNASLSENVINSCFPQSCSVCHSGSKGNS